MPKKTALVVVDTLNTYEHPDAEELTCSVREVLPNIASLVDRARSEGVEVIYVNDNHGAWNQGRSELVEQVSSGPHGDLVEPIVAIRRSSRRRSSTCSGRPRSTRSPRSTASCTMQRWR